MEGTDRSKVAKAGGTESAGAGKPQERAANRSTSTARKESGNIARTGAAGTGAAGTAPETKSIEKSPKVVTVNVPEVVEKPKKKKAATRSTRKKDTVSSEMLSDFIVGVSSMAAAKPETSHWQIDKKEADQISEPLCRIIEKNENLKKVAEQSDSIALVMACVMVIAPRAFMTYQIEKEKKAQKKNKVAKVEPHAAGGEKIDREAGKTTGNSGENHKRNAATNTNVEPTIHELLSI